MAAYRATTNYRGGDSNSIVNQKAILSKYAKETIFLILNFL